MTVEPTPKTPAPEEGATDQPPPAARPPQVEGPPSQQAPVSRRRFLTFGGATAAGLVVGGAVGYAVHQPPSQPAPQTPPPPIRFFTDAQFRVVEAMAERIFPADSEGPGAKEARVAYYIDGQLTSGWGRGERLYLQGPFVAPADSGHGWQIPMTPRDVYKDGLAAIDAYTQKQFNKPYDQLTAKQQDDILQMLSGGKVSTFQTVTSAQFFSMFRQNVLEGLFGDPLYGGNFNLAGWKWLGFPGDPHAYGLQYGKHIFKAQPYRVEPRPLT